MNDFNQTNESHKNQEYSLRLRDIVKKFDSTIAINHMSLEVRTGEIVGLIGPNGAGKSTLMGVLTGVVPATEGSIELCGNAVPKEKHSTTIARENGIACAYQEFSVCSNLEVYENFAITIMDHKPFGKMGWRKELIRVSEETLAEVFPDNGINVRTKVAKLSIEQRQMVEICCAFATNGLKTLILDEPTSSLTNNRITQFHAAIRRLREKGVSVIYISHKLEEILQISTRIIVMRNGEKAWEGTTENTAIEDLVNLMGGRIMNKRPCNKALNTAEHIVDINNLNTSVLHNVNMHICKGECIGISGLGGSGQRELLDEIYRAAKGRKNKSVHIVGDASFVSGDRQNEGIFKLWSIADNIIISSLNQLTKWGLLNKKKCDEMAQHWYDKLKFKAVDKDSLIGSLSGGNQQKAIIGRGIAFDSDLIIFDDLTRGVDAGTKKEIYSILEEICALGKSIIWYSTEDNEMMECDRVYVMKEGSVVEELVGDDISVESVVSASFKNVETAKESVKAKKEAGIGNKLTSFFSNGSTIAVLILICIWIIVSIFNKNTNTRFGMTFLIGTALPLVLVSIAQMFIVGCGDINLGVGNAMGLINALAATLMVYNFGLGLAAMIGVLALYSVIAVLINKRHMPSMVVSLGMMSVWLGIALIVLPTPGGDAPDWLSAFFAIQTPLLPIQVYLCIIVGAVSYWIAFRSKYGMVLRGIGNNPSALTKRGWSYLTAHIITYAISGVFVILAGLAMTNVSKGADANASSSYSLMSIATILLGGCAFSGGIIEPVGVVAGALIVSLISSMLNFMQISTNYRTAVIGIILIVALTGGQLLKRKGEVR